MEIKSKCPAIMKKIKIIILKNKIKILFNLQKKANGSVGAGIRGCQVMVVASEASREGC